MMSPSPKSTDMYQRIKAKHIHCTGEKMKQIDRTGGQKKSINNNCAAENKTDGTVTS